MQLQGVPSLFSGPSHVGHAATWEEPLNRCFERSGLGTSTHSGSAASRKKTRQLLGDFLPSINATWQESNYLQCTHPHMVCPGYTHPLSALVYINL